MNFLIVLLIIIFTSINGYIIIRGLSLIENKLFSLACSYGLGIGLISFQLYIYSRINITWELPLIIIPWIIISGIILYKNKKKFTLQHLSFPALKKFEIILIILISFVTLYTIFEATIRPATTWDSWATWLVTAKIFFTEGRINPDSLSYISSEYPLILKLHWALVYKILGKIDDTAVLLTSSAFYIFLLLTFFASLRKKYTLRYVLIFVFLMATTQTFIRQGGRLEAGQADLALAYFFFISTLLLLSYIKSNRGKTFLLLNIFLAITSLIKMEGLPFALVVESIALYHIYRNKQYNHLLIILVWILPIIDWRLFRLFNNLESYYSMAHPIEISLQKTINAISGTFGGLINIKSWNILWIVYFYLIIFFGLMRSNEHAILNFIILSQLLLYLIVYIFTFGNAPNSSIERLLAHIAPIVFYYIATQQGLFNYGYLKRLNLSGKA